MDFSRIFFAYATMSNGVRDGARLGIVRPGDPDNPGDPRNQAIRNEALRRTVVIGGSTPNPQVFYPNDCAERLCPLQVRMSSVMDVWTPIIPSVTIVATSTMHIE
jgi:hypothetical protein